MSESKLLQCYNRGCGQKFNPKDNKNDSCRHHPGEPFFHDAYKGWSCCNKKCTDFTEFLNIKGCTLSQHSNVKPPEPEKELTERPEEIIEVKPIVVTYLPRPTFDSPLVIMEPEVAQSLKQQVKLSEKKETAQTDSDEIPVGTQCKNGGCKATYTGNLNECQKCVFHPGYPVFHEGLKFWSCCKKRTTDFQAFLDQVGCEEGEHLWKKSTSDGNKVKCRWDFHQTATHVIVAIYAKQYDISKSCVKLSPIRLYANLVFTENDSSFLLDIELKGIVDVAKSKVTMFGTKVEISLKKAEAGSWADIEVPRIKHSEKEENNRAIQGKIDETMSKVDAVDLSDL